MPPKAQDQKYRAQKYGREWEKESWARNWLCMSKKGVSKAYCKVCDKDLASGKSELISHSKTAVHMALMKQVESNPSMETFLEESLNRNKVKAELNTVALMARRSVPLRFLDHLLETLHFVADDSKTIRDMKCNRSKGTYLLTECLSTYAHQRLLEGIMTANGISILCDKATDIMKKTFCVNVRYVDSECATTKTKLYHLLPVDGNGGADSLFSILEDALMEDGIEWG